MTTQNNASNILVRNCLRNSYSGDLYLILLIKEMGDIMSQRTYYSQEAKQQAQMKTTIIVAICIGLGVTIGTIVAMLFAPQSGDETREDLSGATNSALDHLQHQVNDLRKRLEDRVS